MRDYQSGASAMRTTCALKASGYLHERGHVTHAKRLFAEIESIPLPADPASSEGGDAGVERRSGHSKLVYDKAKRAIVTVDPRDAEIATLREALEFYGENARLCRLIHSGGDEGRQALSDDGGKIARAALARKATP